MFLPENIDLANASKYILTIRISSDTFSMMIQDTSRDDNYAYQETAFSGNIALIDNIKRIVFDNNFLTDSFKQVNVVFVSTEYSFIPLEFYDPRIADSLYSFTRRENTSQIIECEKKNSDNKCLFGVNKDVYLFLVRSLYNPRFFHHSNLVLNYLQARADFLKHNSVYINFHSNFADIICFNKQGKLIQELSYFDEEEINIAYYALCMWEKYKLDQYADALYVYGYPSDPNIISDIKRYVKHVENVGLIDQINDFGEKAQSVPLDILILLANENS